jgi:hypothetical protein
MGWLEGFLEVEAFALSQVVRWADVKCSQILFTSSLLTPQVYR